MRSEEAPGDDEQDDDGKLVRDRLPEILHAAGLQPVITVLNEAAYRRALRRKLLEEAREAAEADDAALLDELGDVHELVAVLAQIAGVSLEDVATKAERKRAARGGFHRRLWLAGISG